MLVARKLREDKGKVEIVAPELNTESNIKVAKPPTFNGGTNRVSGFIIAYRLYLRMRMRKI